MFDPLLEDDPLVQEKFTEGLVKGKSEGIAEGLVKAEAKGKAEEK